MKRKPIRAGTPRRKFMFITKSLGVLFLFMSFSLQAGGIAQAGRITLDMKNTPLDGVLKEISRQSNIDLIYSSELISRKGSVDIRVKDEELTNVLNKLLPAQDLEYVINDEMIVIRENTTTRQSNDILLRGRVYDDKGHPLAGASIVIKGTTRGVNSDAEGRFELRVADQRNTVLVVSFLGKKTVETTYTGQAQITVTLEDDVADIGDVVVTGIFNKPRESYVGAVTTITADELKHAGSRGVMRTIANIDPSFYVVTDLAAGSNPNHMPEINIRGNSSLRDIQDEYEKDPNLPLFIVDGFEVTYTEFYDLNDNDVQQINILKDASASALYGSRGANGVIVVVTKQPEPGRLRVRYSAQLTVEAPDLTSYDLMNAREKLQYEVLAGLYDPGYRALGHSEQRLKDLYNQRRFLVESGVDTYWLKYPVRTGVGSSHDVRVEGGSDQFRFTINGRYQSMAGAMKGSERNTFSGSVKLSYYYKNLIFNNQLSYSDSKGIESPYGSFDKWAGVNPYFRPYDDNGNLLATLDNNAYFTSWSASLGARSQENAEVYNPLYNALLKSINESRSNTIRDNFAVDWKILPELILRGAASVSLNDKRTDVFKSPDHTDFYSYSTADWGRRGSYELTQRRNTDYEVNLDINYVKTFNEKHQIYAGGRFRMAQDTYDYNFTQAEGFPSGSTQKVHISNAMQYTYEKTPEGDEGKSRALEGALSFNYTYDRRYYGDLNVNISGSSDIGRDKRLQPFWSAGAGWNMHHEKFMQSQRVLTIARFRLSYGRTGSQSYQPYQALRSYKYYTSDYYQYWSGAEMMALGNPDLQWQTTDKFNVGFDLNFFSRLNLEADFYIDNTDNLLADMTIPSSSGFTKYRSNVGKIRNKGFQVTGNFRVVSNPDNNFYLTLRGSLYYNKNTIKKISDALKEVNELLLEKDKYQPSYLFEEGGSTTDIYVVPSLGIDPGNGKEIFVKRDGTYTYEWDSADKVSLGSTTPKFNSVFSLNTRYRNFSLDVGFRTYWGGVNYNSTLINKVENLTPYNNGDRRALYERWSTPGVPAKYKNIEDYGQSMASSRFVMKDRTLQMTNIKLGYTLYENEWLVKKLGISALEIYGSTENVFTASSIKVERGTSYPFARSFTVQLFITF